MPLLHDRLGTLPTVTERTFTTVADPAHGGARTVSVHENILDPGAVVPRHEHAVEEVIVCLDGEGEATLGDAAPEAYRQGSVLVIPPGTPHTLRNTGSGRLVQLAVMGGPETLTTWHEDKGSVA